MRECTIAGNKMVPLTKVVKGAIVDVYGDIGKLQELYTHWAARGLKKLQRESLKLGKQRVLLPVNGNTRTATLPVDFEDETFVGFLDHHGKKIALRVNTSLVNDNSIVDVDCVDKCPKCGQDMSICNELTVSETVELIVINDAIYEKTIIKKLYPNGDYFLETTTPILNIDDNTISYFTQKEFINNLDLKPCGCLETTPENLALLKACRPDVFCCHFAECGRGCNLQEGSYLILYDLGLIQLSGDYRFDNVYVEYWSFIPKKDGQYLVPEVAFETLVGWTKFKAVENKSNVPIVERNWVWQRYLVEKGNMLKEMGRVPLEVILQASMNTPKLDIFLNPWRDCFRNPVNQNATSSVPATACDTPNQPSSGGGSTVIYLYKNIVYKKIQFRVGDAGSPMIDGQTELMINDTQIFNGSVNVILDGVVMFENLGGAIYYGVIYSSTGIKITIYNTDPDNPSINYGVSNGQKYKITYTQTV